MWQQLDEACDNSPICVSARYQHLKAANAQLLDQNQRLQSSWLPAQARGSRWQSRWLSRRRSRSRNQQLAVEAAAALAGFSNLQL